MTDIRILHVSKRFGDRPVLCDFNAVLTAGRTTCLMGPSGCGKTTLANLILGLDAPDSGEILGVPDRLAAVFQEDRLCEDFSVLSNLRFSVGGKLTRRDAERLLEELGLSGETDTPVRELSGGMKRRVALGRALCADWQLLVLDEPFRGLDENTRRLCIGVLKKRCAGRTVLCITHEPEDVSLLEAPLIRMEAAPQAPEEE